MTSPLKLTVEQPANPVVIRCSGKLVAGSTDVLWTEVSRQIPDTARIVLDLTDLAYMDSRGLGMLIRLFVSAKSAGCDLELINLSPRIRELFGVTNLLSVFAMCGDPGVMPRG